MVFQGEAGRREAGEVARTGLDFEDPLAAATLKVVMVMCMGDLKPRILTRQQDRTKFTLLDQAAQIAIDRGQTETWNRPLCGLQHLLRQQRTSGPGNGLTDCSALASFSLHA